MQSRMDYASRRQNKGGSYGKPFTTLEAGQAAITTAQFARDPLSRHGGLGENLFLRWNTIPQGTEAIDVVVHLHGDSE